MAVTHTELEDQTRDELQHTPWCNEHTGGEDDPPSYCTGVLYQGASAYVQVDQHPHGPRIILHPGHDDHLDAATALGLARALVKAAAILADQP